MLKFPFLLFTFCFLFYFGSFAQSTVPQDTFALPHWAVAIDSAQVNYYTVVKEFEQFWTGKTLPVEEDELFAAAPSQLEKEDSIKKTPVGIIPKGPLTEAQKKELRYKFFLAFQYKRFKDWQQAVLPYVQADGHILTEAEKQQIWEQQKH